MKSRWNIRAAGACALLLSLALGACGGRVESTGKPQSGHPSVEINRQGMEGAEKDRQAQGVRNDTTILGGPAEKPAR